MKRFHRAAIVGLILFCLVPTVNAGVTVSTPGVGAGSQSEAFIVNAYTANGSGCEQLKAAPGTGKAIHIKKISIASATPVSVTIGEGETTPGSADTTILGPVKFGTNAANLQWDFYPALRLTTNKSLVMDSDASGDVVVVVEGYVE